MQLFKNKPVRRDSKDESSRGHGQKVIWSACDRALFSFERDGQEVTVDEYFAVQHGIKLEYPNMPIICVSDVRKRGHGSWFPLGGLDACPLSIHVFLSLR